jgi:hypothetical protein
MALLPPPEVRRLRAKIGGHALAASADPLEYTAAARQRFHDSFTDKARSDAQARGEQASEEEISRRDEASRRAHYARLALRSVQARSRAKRLERQTAPTTGDAGAVQEAMNDGTSIAHSSV